MSDGTWYCCESCRQLSARAKKAEAALAEARSAAEFGAKSVAAYVAENKRQREALEEIKKMPCLSTLLGEGNEDCHCATCVASRALAQGKEVGRG